MMIGMKSLHLCLVTLLLLQPCLIFAFASMGDDSDNTGFHRARRGWSMIRLGRGLQTLRLGKRPAPPAAATDSPLLIPAQIRTLLSPYVDESREPFRRQPPFPRYGRDLENQDVKGGVEDLDNINSLLDDSCLYRLLPFLDDRYTHQNSRFKRSVSSSPKPQDRLSGLNGLEDRAQLEVEAFSSNGGDFDEVDTFRTIKSVPRPRVGRQDELLPLMPPIPRAGRRSATFVLQETASPVAESWRSDSENFLRAEKAVPSPRIGRGDLDLDVDRSEKSVPRPRIGRLATELPVSVRVVPSPRVGREDQTTSESEKSYFVTYDYDNDEDGLSVSTKAVPAPRIGRRVTFTLKRSDRAVPSPRVGRGEDDEFSRMMKAVPSPRIGRGEHAALIRSMRAAPTPRVGRQDLLRSTKAVPSPRIGRRDPGGESRQAKAVPAPRIGRQDVSGQGRAPKAVPAPRIGRQEATELPRVLKAIPAPRIGRKAEGTLLRDIKAVPSPRIGRQEEEKMRHQKAVPAPRIGRQDSQELFRALKAVPSPRIGRQEVEAFRVFTAVPSESISRHRAVQLLRSMKAVPSPRIGREESAKLFRFLKAVPSPRIGRQEPEGMRSSKAVPSPRIGRQDSEDMSIISKAVPSPRIGREKDVQTSVNAVSDDKAQSDIFNKQVETDIE